MKTCLDFTHSSKVADRLVTRCKRTPEIDHRNPRRGGAAGVEPSKGPGGLQAAPKGWGSTRMTVLEDRSRPKPLLAGHQDADTGVLPVVLPDPIAAPATEVAPWAVWLSRFGLFAVAVVIAVERPWPWLPASAFAFSLGLAWAAGWRGRQLRNIAFALAVFTSGVNYLSWRFTVIAI